MPSGKPIDWSQYDQLLLDQLSTLTIVQWCSTYAPHISVKAIGARAKKLGIKPQKYIPTKRHKELISCALSKETASMVQFVRNNIDDNSRLELSKIIGLSPARLADLINRHNIKLSKAGYNRAINSSRSACLGRPPWNKGKQLSDEHKEKMAIGRQKMSGRLSKLQASFYRILDENNICYLREEDPKCRFGHWLFDCRITHGTHDFLVEVQGDYIHSLPKNQSKDRAKATYMERYFPNIPLKYVWEHEFGAINRVKQKVRQWIGIDNVIQTDFSFSDIRIIQIDESVASEFLSAFHYLGKLAGRIKLGAFIGDMLIAVSIWSAPTRYETAERLGCTTRTCLELRRFVIHDSYHKKNFGSFLMAKMEKFLPSTVTTLVSFSDPGMDHDGTLYKASNWIYDGDTQSSFFYVDGDGYVLLKKTLFNLAHKMHMKEYDYAQLYEYQKIKTPPKKRFVKFR